MVKNTHFEKTWHLKAGKVLPFAKTGTALFKDVPV